MGIAVLLLCAIPAAAQKEEAPYLYRGILGKHALVEEKGSRSQHLVTAGQTIGTYRVVEVTERFLTLERGGTRYRIPFRTTYTPDEARQHEGIPPYPFRLPPWRSRVRQALGERRLQFDFQEISLDRALADLSAKSGVAISIDPLVYRKRRPEELDVTASSGRENVTLETALRLVLARADLAYFPADGGLRVCQRKDKPAPDRTEELRLEIESARSLAYSRWLSPKGPAPASPTERVARLLASHKLTSEFQGKNLAELLGKITRAVGVNIVVDPASNQVIEKHEGPLRFRPGDEPLGPGLASFLKPLGLDHVQLGTVVYVAPRARIGQLHQRRSIRIDEQRKVRQIEKKFYVTIVNPGPRRLALYQAVAQLEKDLGRPVVTGERLWTDHPYFTAPSPQIPLDKLLEWMAKELKVYGVFFRGKLVLVK